jgi:hypothetical protein
MLGVGSRMRLEREQLGRAGEGPFAAWGGLENWRSRGECEQSVVRGRADINDLA